ncbi:MAG TPA: RpiB/LacA/LacB family sugar-phosphate isomerase [Bryobacteraceae bacterium]|jgi:ribose 5-phosphate isomerase B
MRLGIATDHGGFNLKQDLLGRLEAAGHEVVDFGAHSLVPGDDYPDFVIPLARAVCYRTRGRCQGQPGITLVKSERLRTIA